MDCSLPSSSAHRVSQARILEWVAISSAKGSSWLKDGTHISWFFTTEPPGKPPDSLIPGLWEQGQFQLPPSCKPVLPLTQPAWLRACSGPWLWKQAAPLVTVSPGPFSAIPWAHIFGSHISCYSCPLLILSGYMDLGPLTSSTVMLLELCKWGLPKAGILSSALPKDGIHLYSLPLVFLHLWADGWSQSTAGSWRDLPCWFERLQRS